jgi:alpha-L-fucosidase
VYFHKKPGFDNMDPAFFALYGNNQEGYVPVSDEFLDLWWKRTTEIIDRYEPDIMWFDFYIDNEEFIPYHPKLAAYYYNRGLEWEKEVVLQTKNMFLESFPEGSNVLDIERGKLSKTRKFFWQTDTSVGENSWGYVSNWISKQPNTLVDDLIDIVSKNGCMLLNVGPDKDGLIPEDQQEVLLELGAWLKLNGEGIYGSRPWTVFGEGPTVVEEGHHSEGGNQDMTAEDFRYTLKKGDVFVYCLDVPEGEVIELASLNPGNGIEADQIASVTLLAGGTELDWEMGDEGLRISTGELPGGLQHAVGFKVDLK